VGGSVETIDDDTVSIVSALDTRRTTVTEANIPEEIITVVCEGVG
jgi:hypothetical protein